MGINFTNIMKKIVSVDELKDFSVVEEKLDKLGEAFIFQNNKPTHVLLTIKMYEEIMNGCKENSCESDNLISEDNLEILLNKIGKRIFIEYYEVFKADENAEKILKACCGFSIASCRSRCSSARTIFKNNMQILALRSIVSSKRVDVDIAMRAKELLEMEQSGSIANPVISVTNNNGYEVKIGKMMRGILSRLLKNHMLSSYEMSAMQTPDYSKEVFNLNFPVLKKIQRGETKNKVKRDAKGYNRYYEDSVIVNGEEYIICSQWVEALHGEKAERWVIERLSSVVQTVVDTMSIGTEFCVRDILVEYWPFVGWSLRQRIGLKYKSLAQEDITVTFKEQKNDCQYYEKK